MAGVGWGVWGGNRLRRSKGFLRCWVWGRPATQGLCHLPSCPSLPHPRPPSPPGGWASCPWPSPSPSRACRSLLHAVARIRPPVSALGLPSCSSSPHPRHRTHPRHPPTHTEHVRTPFPAQPPPRAWPRRLAPAAVAEEGVLSLPHPLASSSSPPQHTHPPTHPLTPSPTQTTPNPTQTNQTNPNPWPRAGAAPVGAAAAAAAGASPSRRRSVAVSWGGARVPPPPLLLPSPSASSLPPAGRVEEEEDEEEEDEEDEVEGGEEG